MEIDNKLRVNANPTKELFISMLTRDIDVKAAIVELIDNSIDGAKRIRPDGNFEGLYIKIHFDKNKFVVEDNCGGMSIYVAQNYAFRFGRPRERKENEKEEGLLTGIFGIGMKRSLFRLGNFFSIVSKTNNESFEMNVNVNEWLNDESTDWSFSFSKIANNVKNSEEECGTKIVITELHKGIKEKFLLDYFKNELIEYVTRHKTLITESHLEIFINSNLITILPEKIILSDFITPYTFSYDIDNVKISILAGIAPKGKPENAGWYIYCNGRLVVFADRGSLTGWGEDGARQYHPSLAFFRGFVFFESTDLESLPWNTTKTNVDSSSNYYISAKTKMREATNQILALGKSIEELDEEDKKDYESRIFNATALQTIDTFFVNKITSTNSSFIFKQPLKKNGPTLVQINFRKEKELVDKAKKLLNITANSDLGKYVFDYFYEREFTEDE